MVTSLGMTEMKWVIADLNQTLKWNIVSVKEQRVDGSPVILLLDAAASVIHMFSCKVYSSHRETGSGKKYFT